MKISIISMIGLLILLSIGNLEAQVNQAEAEIMKKEISEDLIKAAQETSIGVNESLIEAFVSLGLSQIDAFREVYASVPKKARVARLVKYLIAKDKIGGIPSNVTSNDLSDFHWGYIQKDTGYSPLRLVSPKMAVLVAVEYDSGHYNFLAEGEGFRPGAALLIPKAPGQESADVSATFELGGQKALWTGNSTLNELKVVNAKSSKGCEIYVNSEPPEATVYFNKKKWYDITNTSAVRKPGSWEVIIQRDGYKQWSERRNLLAGETWAINALLIKK